MNYKHLPTENTLTMKGRLEWDPSKCIRCGLCVGVCPFDALSLEDGRIVIDHEKCTLCTLCVKGCPVAALRIVGGDGE